MERDRSIDMMKGFGIILVVLGHMRGEPALIRAWIYSFHMPLFFFISGYLFNEKSISINTKEYIIKKGKSLIYPYIILSTFFIVYYTVLERDGVVFIKRVLASIYSAKIFSSNYTGVIWFLTSLFCVEIIFFIIAKYKNKNRKIYFLFAILGAIYPYITTLRLPFGLDIALTGVMFYYLGNILKNKTSKFKLDKYIMLYLLINIVSMFINYKILIETEFNGRVDMLYMEYGNIIIFYVSAVSGILFCYSLSKIVRNKLIEFMGKNSLIIMAFHLIILSFVVKIVGIINLSENIEFLLSFTITLAICCIVSIIINKYFFWTIRYTKKLALKSKNNNNLHL